MKLKHKKLLLKLIPIAALLAVTGILTLLKKSVAASEFFTRTFSRAYFTVAGFLTSIFPFSVYEAFMYIAGIVLIILIVRWIILAKRNRKTKALNGVINVVTAVVCILTMHTFSASLAYNRKPLPVPQYEGENLGEDDLVGALNFYFDDYNNIKNQVQRDAEGKVVVPYSGRELAEILAGEYERIGTLDGYLHAFTPKVKSVGTSIAMSYMNITGVAFTAFGEANINSMTPPLWKIKTAAHELAHTKGVMREADANLLAKYMLLTSENIYLRYSFYTYNLYTLLRAAVTLPQNVLSPYRDAIKQAEKDRALEQKFWDDYESIIDKISDFINDTYLKLSGVKEGVQNYVDLDKIHFIVLPGGQVKPVVVEYSDVQKLMLEHYLLNKPAGNPSGTGNFQIIKFPFKFIKLWPIFNK